MLSWNILVDFTHIFKISKVRSKSTDVIQAVSGVNVCSCLSSELVAITSRHVTSRHVTSRGCSMLRLGVR